MKKNENFFSYVNDFVEDMRLNLKSEKTIETYIEGLNSFRKYLSKERKIKLQKMTWEVIGPDIIREYLKHLIDEHMTISTRNTRLTSIKQYIAFCTYKHIELTGLFDSINKIKCKTVIPKKHNWISKEQIMLILEQTNRNKKGIRDRFIMFFLFATGVRLSELLSIKLKDIEIGTKYSYVRVLGKGNKTRIIPVTKEFIDNYQYYLTLYHSHTNSDDYIFHVKIKGQRFPMSEDNVQRILNKYGLLAKKIDSSLPKIHPHLFRHSFGALMYRNGLSLPEIAKLMGHEQLSTTEIYAETDIEMLKKAFEKANINDKNIDNKWDKLTENERLRVLGLKK